MFIDADVELRIQKKVTFSIDTVNHKSTLTCKICGYRAIKNNRMRDIHICSFCKLTTCMCCFFKKSGNLCEYCMLCLSTYDSHRSANCCYYDD